MNTYTPVGLMAIHDDNLGDYVAKPDYDALIQTLAQERQRRETAERDLATLTEWKDTLVQTGDDALQDVQSLKRELSASEAKLIETRKDLSDLQSTFDLQWAAAQRAIREWQAEHPGAENTWPDHKHLLLWLMRKITGVRYCLPSGRQNTNR